MQHCIVGVIDGMQPCSVGVVTGVQSPDDAPHAQGGFGKAKQKSTLRALMAARRSVAYVAVKVRGREGRAEAGVEAGIQSPEAGSETVGGESKAEQRDAEEEEKGNATGEQKSSRVCNTEWFFLECRRWFECERTQTTNFVEQQVPPRQGRPGRAAASGIP